MIPTIASITNANASPPQNGSVTHHQDQSMIPINFSIINATPRSPRTPSPELLELDLLILNLC